MNNIGKLFWVTVFICSSSPAGTHIPQHTLVVPVTSITDFNTHRGNDFNLNKVVDQIALNLVSLDNSLSPIPELADKWTIDSKKNEITFHLKENKIFHDGSSIKPSDIFSVFRDSARNGSDLTSQIEGFTSCVSSEKCHGFKIASDRSFKIKLSDNNFAYFLRKLAGIEGAIFKKHPAFPYVIGSGPYKLKAIEPNRIVVECVDDSLPLRIIEFRKTPANEGLKYFIDGELDTLSNIDYEVDEKKIPKESRRQDRVAVTFGLLFNVTPSSIFSKIEVRRAIDLAINKSKFIEMYGSRAIPATGLIPKGFLGYHKRNHEVDIEQSKTLIQRHVPTRQRTVVIGLRNRYRGNPAVETYLPAVFKEIGLKLVIRYNTFSQVLQDFRKGKLDLTLKGDAPRYYESSTVFIPFIKGQSQNVSQYSNLKLTRLYYTYEKTTDVSKKTSLLEEMELIVGKELPTLPLFHPVLSTWYSTQVQIKDFKKLVIRFWDFPYHQMSKTKGPNVTVGGLQ